MEKSFTAFFSHACTVPSNAGSWLHGTPGFPNIGPLLSREYVLDWLGNSVYAEVDKKTSWVLLRSYKKRDKNFMTV